MLTVNFQNLDNNGNKLREANVKRRETNTHDEGDFGSALRNRFTMPKKQREKKFKTMPIITTINKKN